MTQREKLACVVCGTTFTPKHKRHLTCSPKCSKRLNALRGADKARIRTALYRHRNPDIARRSTREAWAKYRNRLGGEGFRQITVWVHDNDRETLKRFAYRLARRRTETEK